MNEQCLYCPKTKEYVDAGYRWAYSLLVKPGICKHGQKVDIEKLLEAREYWDIDDSEDSKWLKEGVLPLVKDFIDRNRKFDIFYGEQDHFLDVDEPGYWEWLDVGYRPDKSPRYFFEVLEYRTWNQIECFVNKNDVYHGNKPWWWNLQPVHNEARKFFEDLII